MAQDVDFHGIGEALAALIRVSVSGFKAVLHEPDSIQLSAFNTPLCTVMMEGDGESQPRVGQSYVDTWTYIVEVVTIDLSNWATAAARRTELFRACRDVVRNNPRFHVDIETSMLGRYEFERAIDRDKETWFAAVARFEVRVSAYNDL